MTDNIFIQILTAIKVVNDNLVTMSQNMDTLKERLDKIQTAIYSAGPDASGAVKDSPEQ